MGDQEEQDLIYNDYIIILLKIKILLCSQGNARLFAGWICLVKAG